ncbi:MAG: DUF924 domain-containing protein [Rhodospirillaceae bacterium]|nr:DUF924 domain-containing protein [Rhodospirillaceae bacterium]MBL6929936.1 DUF924 domain-containing protein [Rhodospirillales bacterium]MBL6942508.1 DUF924 domain-containing protein [Rhodospirillales bacterium]
MSDRDVAQRVRDFWFGEEGTDVYGTSRPEWFTKDPAFDNQIREKFSADVDAALDGGYSSLMGNQMDALALIILLDQFPRNLFRDTAAMFAGDKRALAYANEAVRMGFDQNLTSSQQMFFYLPFEHSESLDDQRRCIDFFKRAGNEDLQKWAVAHHDIIARFGRFPHRNIALGRESTAEELAFLEQPNSSF